MDTPISERLPRKEQSADSPENPFAELQATFEQLAAKCAQARRALEAKLFRFYLVEKEYTHSPLASGVLFEDGTVALRFYAKTHTRHLGNTLSYHSLKELLFQDGKEGRCVIQWIDGPPREEVLQ